MMLCIRVLDPFINGGGVQTTKGILIEDQHDLSFLDHGTYASFGEGDRLHHLQRFDAEAQGREGFLSKISREGYLF